MFGRSSPFEDKLVPGRECGNCNVCCVALTINEKALQKVQGCRCPNSAPDKRCGIYETRPQTCRSFYCGWRLLKWVREPMRPDVSGVLVQLHVFSPAERPGVSFMLLNGASLRAEGLAESIAAAVAADVPVFLRIPGPPGHTGSHKRINDALKEAVIRKDKRAILRILREARATDRLDETVPVVLRPTTDSAAGVPTDV